MIRATLCGVLSIPLLFLYSANPAFSQASTSFKCGDTIYELTTGTKKGACTGDKDGAACVDQDGNTSVASCDKGCSATSGSGDCKIKAAQTPPPKKIKDPPVKPVSVGGAKPTDPPPKRKSPTTPVSTGGSKQTGDNNQSGTIGKTDTQHSGGGSKH